MRALKCFSRLKMCTHIEDAFFSNRSPLYTVVSKNVVSISHHDTSVVNFDSRMISIGSLNEKFYYIPCSLQSRRIFLCDRLGLTTDRDLR